MDHIFRRTDILLPKDADMERWSVIACDQFTSQPEYWDALEQSVGSAPSTLRLILPEAYLGTRDLDTEAARINGEMERCLSTGVFREIPDSYILVERILPSGVTRWGLIGAIDLEAYDFRRDTALPVRATEGVIQDRLPPRVRIREKAALELPHTIVFCNDARNLLFDRLVAERDTFPLLYDFPLYGGGGRIRGYRVSGKSADAVDEILEALFASPEPLKLAVGDGNHSVATAKRCWERRKSKLAAAARETDPARWTLVELENLHDPAIRFEPIHRALLDTDPAAFLREAREVFNERYCPGTVCHDVRLVTAEEDLTVSVPSPLIGQLIGSVEEFCRYCANRFGGRLDYIHNEEAALALGRRPGNASLLLPRMEKDELFPTVSRTGAFPKKSFSIGRAEEKRYYLECRKITAPAEPSKLN